MATITAEQERYRGGEIGDGLLPRLAAGAAAGLAGTMAMQAVRTATAAARPDTNPPVREEPGAAVVHAAESATLSDQTRGAIPEGAEKAAGMALGMGYGATFGALYAVVRPAQADASALVDGAALGFAAWAAGYLGWLPASGLMPPVTDQKKRQVIVPLLQHLVFGIVTVAACKEIGKRI